MKNKIGHLPHWLLVLLVSSSLVVTAEPIPQTAESSGQQSAPDDSKKSADSEHNAQAGERPTSGQTASQARGELPDDPSAVQPAQQDQGTSPRGSQKSGSVPSGAAGAKAPTVRGAPASRTVGAAIAPAKQRQHRSLLIKAGLIAGACVAVGSAFALSKGSPSKPPGAP